MYYSPLSCFFTELRAFVLHVTGKSIPAKKSIQVDFMDGGDDGAISAHTCSSLITFPRGMISTDDSKSYDFFKTALTTVMSSPGELSFNTA